MPFSHPTCSPIYSRNLLGVVMRYRLIHFLLLNLFIISAFAAGSRPVEMDDDEDLIVPEKLQLTVSKDMPALSKLSRKNNVPILLMFASEDCHYCKRLETEVLGPMRLAGIDPKQIILRKVMMDEYDELRDFAGNKRNAESFSINRGVEVVPTLQLVNAKGEELVPKIVGYQTPGLYSGYLEKAIEVSRELLNQK
jgi:thioredoxin-related protein